MKDKKYALLYTSNAKNRKEGYDVSDIENEFQGLCDAMVFVSIVRPEDGSYSQLVISRDGETNKELTQKDLFKVWMSFGMMLANNKTLKGWHKQIIDIFEEMVQLALNL